VAMPTVKDFVAAGGSDATPPSVVRTPASSISQRNDVNKPQRSLQNCACISGSKTV
jgi:hypothetical protein